MKLIPVCLLFLLAAVSCLPSSPEDEKIKKTIEALHNGRAHLKAVLAELRADLDKKLIDLLPELKEKILKLHGDIDACYDQTITKNVTVNILEDKVHKVVEKFFKTHGHILKGLTLKQVHERVKAFVGNLAQLVTLLVDCVAKKIKGKPTMKLGLTSMSIYSREEIENKILNKKLSQTPSNQTISLKAGGGFDECSLEPQPNENIPAVFSWKTEGKVSPVYHQYQCGSCYVFSTTSALESQYMIHSGKSNIPHYSVQATLNCMLGGCGGGGLIEPLQRFIDKGVTEHANAPYVDKVEACVEYPAVLKAERYCYHSGLDEKSMQLLLMRNGPAAIAIDASSKSLTYLKDSIFTEQCGTALDHAVLLVGWDESNWIIKNSWGDSWGIEGYLHLPRGQNKCGVQAMFGQPIVKKF